MANMRFINKIPRKEKAGIKHLTGGFDINSFYIDIRKVFSDELIYLGMHGSYANGFSTLSSDIDFTLVLRKITLKSLYKLKNIVAKYPRVSVYFLSKADLHIRPLSNNLQFFHGQRPLFGILRAKKPNRKDLIERLLLILEDVRHNYRYFYLSKNAEINKEITLTLGKLVFWWYQIYLFILKDKYFVTPEQVVNMIDNDNVKKVIRQYNKNRRGASEPSNQPNHLLQFHSIIDDMITRLSKMKVVDNI